ncbi:flavodoxin family protein [Maribacter sp. CXY002]|uniref:flavodoxin family protein n=1 Tax=Maribacter luteocoastalis TaxID=3407671 RepID=UPI003B6809E2
MNKILIVFVFLSSCLYLEPGKTQQKSNNTLIVYLSRTNNTKAIAEIIHEKIGGDLLALELVHPYPENYKAIVEQVAAENKSGFLPPLKTKVDVRKYDTIFIGFPTWGMQLPPPIKSFLNAYDLSGKIVIPFNTNAGYGIGSSFKKVQELCKGCEILDGFSTKGGIERDSIFLVIQGDKKKQTEKEVTTWLESLKILKP